MVITEKEFFDHKTNAEDYVDIVNKLTMEYTNSLDEIVNEISYNLKRPDYELDTIQLQSFYICLSTELFLMVDKLKQFEIYSSLAKSNESEAYNKAYLEASIADGKKPTVSELQIRAENSSKKESLINTVYSSAYKTIKSKIDSGNLIVDTLKNIIKVRTNIEYSTSQVNNSIGGI